MRSEEEVRRAIDRLRFAVKKFDPEDPEGSLIIGGMQSQIDVLLWAVDEPSPWDKVHKVMNAYHFEHGQAPSTTT